MVVAAIPSRSCRPPRPPPHHSQHAKPLPSPRGTKYPPPPPDHPSYHASPPRRKSHKSPRGGPITACNPCRPFETRDPRLSASPAATTPSRCARPSCRHTTVRKTVPPPHHGAQAPPSLQDTGLPAALPTLPPPRHHGVQASPFL
jgi:hypothetical protein